MICRGVEQGDGSIYDVDSLDVRGFSLSTRSVTIGEEFSFEVQAKDATMVRLEYGIDLVKSNGNRNRKIFQT